MTGGDLPGSFPERETDPRDDRTGWERPRPVDVCACGRAVSGGGKCVWCWHLPKVKP